MATNKKETEQSEVACYDTKTFQGQHCKRLQAVAEAHAGIRDGCELVKKLTQEVYNAILEAEMEEHLGYGWHDREGRGSGNSRNGKLTKKVIADIDELAIETPRDRNGTFEPTVIEKRQTKLKHFSGNIISLYTRGLTTREIENHLREIYEVEVSESFIPRVTDEVKEQISEWQMRALDPLYSIVYFDGIRFNVREDGRVKNKVLYVCYGIALDGRPDVFDLWISKNEGAGFWLSICNELKNRGVKNILIACVDGLSGPPEAIKSVFSKVDV
ncbi:MAG: IS256 family transposase [Deltaproteobacteria bacterium]|nr:IS256 family transposase [Deltaproteobacteria bacterium]